MCGILNLGILAHVDAGKTTLSERLLFAAGVTRELGSVDAGTTQTDSLALERERGITIRAAVVSFAIDDVTINLIDTPGHPDFIAEVERVLSVLDGAVLVVSAVEGVQPQTRVLMRALQRLSIPTLLFVNKIDRPGAGCERVVEAIAQRLTSAVIAMGGVDGLGTRAARFRPVDTDTPAFRSTLTELLAERDDSVLAAYVADDRITSQDLSGELAAQIARAVVHPVFFGSAITGSGVGALMEAIPRLLPAATGDADGPLSAAVFKIERGTDGERVAYVRMFSGAIHARDRVHFGDGREGKVTALSVFDDGAAARRPSVRAGEIAKLWGFDDVQVGDRIGETPMPRVLQQFPRPTLEAVVAPHDPADRARLRVALGQLAEQDPLINIQLDDRRQEISVSLYGEVQRQVIEATLEREYGIAVSFAETTPIYIERPAGAGEAVELLHGESNPFAATIGLRIEPAPEGSGVEFRLGVDSRTIPMYVYKRREAFAEHMRDYVGQALREGLYGWEVTDCIVTMIQSNYQSPDGSAATRGSLSTAADFRRLTPPVVMQALARAGTVVCEPAVRISVELPVDMIGVLAPALGRLGAAVQTPTLRGGLATIDTTLSAARAQVLQRQLPRLSGGEGVLESEFAGYRPVPGEPPVRPRTTANPRDWGEHTMQLARRDLPA